MNLAEMRTFVRRDLHDEDPRAYRWTNSELDRHIQHAVDELNLAVPVEATALLTTGASRDLSLSAVSGLIGIEAVEYPVDKYPPVFVPFNHWGQTLTLLVDKTPSSGESVRLYHAKSHTLSATSSTIPSHLEELVVVGAAAFAALQWAAFAVNRPEPGDREAARQYVAWGKAQAATFQRSLNRLAARNTVRSRHLYVAALPKPSQSTDWGP